MWSNILHLPFKFPSTFDRFMSEQRPMTIAQSESFTVHSSLADVWYLKQIFFKSRPVKIITQNFNGPCSFIAICNILILRGQIEILPPDRTSVSYEFLSQLVGDYLLTNCPDIDISAVLSILPTTTKGLDLNPQFTSITAFSPTSDADAGELDLFARAGIPLVHGWLVDPHSPEAGVMAHIRDYDAAVMLIADADHVAGGRLLNDGGDLEGGNQSNVGRDEDGWQAEPAAEGEAGPSSRSAVAAGPSSLTPPRHHATPDENYSDEDRLKIEQAIVAQRFLDATKSQLTYHGLFQLASTLEPGSLVALFRNAHLSVVYRSPGTPHTDVDANTNPGPSTSVEPNADTDASANTDTPAARPVSLTNSAFVPAEAESALYALVTDVVFLHESSIVWERLEDVDGGWSTFCDSDFHRAVPIGGDVAGQTAEGALRRYDAQVGVDLDDQAFARQLQAEEDASARKEYQHRQRLLAERRRADEGEGQGRVGGAWAAVEERRRRKEDKGRIKGKKIKECVVM